MEMKNDQMREAGPESRARKTKWGTTIFLVISHAAAIAALFYWSWAAVITAVILYWVGGSLGIGMGFHRLITHRGYKVPKVVEYFLVICGTLALEGGPIQWVATHRMHHAHTDRTGDPHTPRDGGWWAHIGWILRGSAQDDYDANMLQQYAPDMLKDRFYVWLNNYYYVPLIIVGLLLFVFGGWQIMLWGVFLRTTLALHATWLVNSATHMWGTKRFETGDDSRNSWWVALLTFGEGWHNNHHAHPTSAQHGLRWYEVDLNWWGIRVFQLLGLARRIKRVRFSRSSEAWHLVTGGRGKSRRSLHRA